MKIFWDLIDNIDPVNCSDGLCRYARIVTIGFYNLVNYLFYSFQFVSKIMLLSNFDWLVGTMIEFEGVEFSGAVGIWNNQTDLFISLSECWPQVQAPIQEGNASIHWDQWRGDCWLWTHHWGPFKEVWEGKIFLKLHEMWNIFSMPDYFVSGNASRAERGPEECSACYDHNGWESSPLVSI